MHRRGIHLQYSFGPDDQRGADVHNPLFDLLLAVEQHGSIRHAADALGASYRHVWGQLKQWEGQLGEALVSWTQGQPARLTPFAARLLWAERRARTRLTPHIEALRAELERVLTDAFDGSQQVLALAASHDLALPALRQLASAQRGLHVELRFAGSIDCLGALSQGRCLVAGFHVPRLADGSAVFARALKPLLTPGRHKLIGCMRRRQGVMVAPGNPLGVEGVADLPRLRFVNRPLGSGTRVLMDHLLDVHGIAPGAVAGYLEAPGEDSHVAVAAAVASGLADAGAGIQAAAAQFGLGFVPLIEEDYFLASLKESLEHPAVQELCALLASPAWAEAPNALAGYTPMRGGEVLSLTQALPWWHFRRAKAAPKASAR